MAHISDKWRVSTFSGNGGILHLQDASAMQIAAVLGLLRKSPTLKRRTRHQTAAFRRRWLLDHYRYDTVLKSSGLKSSGTVPKFHNFYDKNVLLLYLTPIFFRNPGLKVMKEWYSTLGHPNMLFLINQY